MKKVTTLLLLTLPVILLALSLPNLAEKALPQAEVIRMATDTYSETISATGKIEEVVKSEIGCKFPIVPKEVYAEVGDQVEIGEVLATVDLEKTKQGILSMGMMKEYLSEDVVTVLSGLNLDLEVLLSQIPTEIVADSSGTLSSFEMVKGVLSYPGDVLAVISNLDGIQAKLSVPEEYAEKLAVNQPVELKASAIKGKKYTGVVKTVFPTAHDTLVGTSSQTVVNLYVKLDSQETELKAGYSVTGKIDVGGKHRVATLPYEAVNQDDDGQEFVYCYQSGKAVRKDVTTGAELSDALEITGGLSPDDFVIRENGIIDHDGQYVSVLKQEDSR